ncbi:ferry endosomal RAB5 effector complex subunit 3 [Onthophagus taurus]|uniref:ferry endosomal RAB5 effector complex subunit 3 n=1 Tax=Onthophagus taurus TaxID=166361 RepID=UPI000C20621F|nr:protein C12orf4 [Onthophagus taurus]
MDVTFSYVFENYYFEENIKIPINGNVSELAYILLNKYELPDYASKDLIAVLTQFIDENTEEEYNKSTNELLKKCKENKFDVEELAKEWEKQMREEMADHGERKCASDEELFATAYHKMVHSPALETMLKWEHVYAQTVREKCYERDRLIRMLSDEQGDEMSAAEKRLEKGVTESDINALIGKHFDDQTLLQAKLHSEIDTLKEAQRREYREWLMQMLEQSQANKSLPTPKTSPLAPIPPSLILATSTISRQSTIENQILEESFTIHLGSQLKQMHNIRILRANVMSLCDVDDDSSPTPQCLQTALGLYSNDLSGLVLITDDVLPSRVTEQFRKICQKTTEFHFQHVDDQLEIINNLQKQKSLNSASSNRKSSRNLQSGDFYITRHSNLSQVHVIFHIVADDSIRGNDINSRHPVVLGLRNIVKTACSNDITSLTIPLLLSYEMSEDMTISWCEKRAELIFKCVKGFMIEMASWGGSDLKNLQFMLPEGISSEVFQSLTDMLPRIFKVSNPLILECSKEKI